LHRLALPLRCPCTIYALCILFAEHLSAIMIES
jgi:hypothetical protein